MAIGGGRTPRAGASLRAALGRLPAVAGATVLFSLATALGALLLVLPGIYLWVRLALFAQAVMAENMGAREALGRRWELAEDSWWRLFGILLLVTLIAWVVAAVVALPLELAASEAESALLSLVGTIVLDAVTLSFTALAGTLLYFDVRARRGAYV